MEEVQKSVNYLYRAYYSSEVFTPLNGRNSFAYSVDFFASNDGEAQKRASKYREHHEERGRRKYERDPHRFNKCLSVTLTDLEKIISIS